MSLSESLNNRALVATALERIASRSRPCWAALRDELAIERVTSETLSFAIAPRLAAAGRLGSAMPGLHFLDARTVPEAKRWFATLDDENRERRALQARLVSVAMTQAKQKVDEGQRGLAIVLDDGHVGVGGLVASRCVNAFGRASVCLSPKSPGMWSGSLRSVPGYHVRNALERIQRTHQCLEAFGGHEYAAGCRLSEDALATFVQAFETDAACSSVGPFGPWIDVDGKLDRAPSLEQLDELANLEPFGRGFDAPNFEDTFEITGVKPMGDGSHLKLTLRHAQWGACEAVWFQACEAGAPPPPLPRRARFAFALSRNTYRGQSRVQLLVRGLLPAV